MRVIRRSGVRSSSSRMLLVGLLLSSLVRIMIAQGDPEAAKTKNPVPATPESIAAGKQLFQRSFATCHGVNGHGGSGNDLSPGAPGRSDADWKHGSTAGESF